MQYCKTCIMPTTRPGLRIDSNGRCGACRWYEQKKTIDWEARSKAFVDIATWAKNKSRGPFDCVLGVSGGKDSTWQALQLRDTFGLEPLLVQFVSSDGTELGRQNIENLHSLGFTLVSMQPNPQVAQKLSKRSFFEYGNIHKYAEMALFPIPYRVAMAYDVPLVLFGENPALEAGDTNKGEGWDALTIRNNHTLAGDNASIWLEEGVCEKDLAQYDFPDEQAFRRWGGKGVFMGYYLNWSGWENAKIAIASGMHCTEENYEDIGIHYKHNSLDSDFGGIINAHLKYLKFGFGNTTEFASYDVRAGRLTREEAALLVKALDGRCHQKFIQGYCQWIGISVETFQSVAKRYLNQDIFEPTEQGYQLKNPIWKQVPLPKNVDYRDLIERLDTRVETRGEAYV